MRQACREILEFFNPENQTALSAVLLNELDILVGNNKQKLVAQTYNGAAALSSARSGVQ